jgi:hypothetical protein
MGSRPDREGIRVVEGRVPSLASNGFTLELACSVAPSALTALSADRRSLSGGAEPRHHDDCTTNVGSGGVAFSAT